MMMIVAIASSTRGFAVPEADTPCKISAYARQLQDQDEKGSFWESPAAIRAFAGEDITRSVVEPEAQSALLNFDRTATHRSLLVHGRS
jgi:hypothetical protein